MELLAKNGILPGIKVDIGAKPLPFCPDELVTEGLDGLPKRCAEYFKMGAKFAKWRAVITIGKDIPSATCIEENAHALARYAAICQEAGIVPIVEPEVLMDGDHTIDRCEQVTEWTLNALYDALYLNKVQLEGSVLKPSMVISGKGCSQQAGVEEVAERTVKILKRTVPRRSRRCRVPVRRTERRGCDRASQRDESHVRGPHAVAALVLLWPRAAGAFAQSLERQRVERRGRTGGAAPSLAHEQPCMLGPLLGERGTAGESSLNI